MLPAATNVAGYEGQLEKGKKAGGKNLQDDDEEEKVMIAGDMPNITELFVRDDGQKRPLGVN